MSNSRQMQAIPLADPDNRIIIELIKMNEQNTNIKLDKLNEKLDTFIDSVKEDRTEFNESIRALSNKVDSAISKINTIQEESKSFIKKDYFEEHEKIIIEDVNKFKKNALWGNITFMILVITVLSNNNGTAINWRSILDFLKALF